MADHKTFLVRCGEVALKGTNKPYFERLLAERLKFAAKRFPGTEIKREDGIIVVRTPNSTESDALVDSLARVFGVDTISPAVECPSDMAALEEAAVEYMRKRVAAAGPMTFKVEAKRSDKTFPVESPAIARRIGEVVLDAVPDLRVDVHRPACLLFLHVRRERSFLYDEKRKALGGLPLGTNGKGLVLLSGGIDSPVAAFSMARRGMLLEAVHFHSYPYTSERALDKVRELAGILSVYCGRIKIHSINLKDIQEAIVRACPEDETTILVRRSMVRLAEAVARQTGCLMLVTGENLGQVASQTAESIVVTDAASSLPVMRPLIAMDKTEIIQRAVEIGTYETSILPYEDCCTVFLPRHPVTKPRLADIEESERLLPLAELEAAALSAQEILEPSRPYR